MTAASRVFPFWHDHDVNHLDDRTGSATFTPKSVGNNWWVESSVSASKPIAKVEAKVGSGAWTVLPKTDWGTYAKSINAPNGSVVTFPATDASGGVVTSKGYTWP